MKVLLTSNPELKCQYIRAYTVGSIARVGSSISWNCTGYGELVIHELNIIGGAGIVGRGHSGRGRASSRAQESSICTSHDGTSNGVGATALKIASPRIKHRNVCTYRQEKMVHVRAESQAKAIRSSWQAKAELSSKYLTLQWLTLVRRFMNINVWVMIF